MEYAVEDTVVALAEKHGWIVRKMRWIGRRSAMDRFFLKEGRIVLIEFKRPGGAARLLAKLDDDLQGREYRRFKAAGADVHIIDSVEDACRVLGIQR